MVVLQMNSQGIIKDSRALPLETMNTGNKTHERSEKFDLLWMPH